MLFAWADDPVVKDNIVNLNSPEIIGLFVRGFRGKTAFVFDQMNALDDSEGGKDGYLAAREGAK